MKLKSWVVNTILSMVIFVVCVLTVYLTYSLLEQKSVDNTSYVLSDIAETEEPVIKEVEDNNVISKPYEKDEVSIMTNFYCSDDSAEIEEKSLILYESTYMPSTGVLYGSDNSFNVLSIYQGEVISIEDSEVFGKTVEIKHDNDLVSKYSSITDIKVKVGDQVSSGDIIGVSSENKIISTCKNMLFFELISKGTNINPESYYGISINNIG